MRMVFEEGERAALIAQLGLADDADEQALATAVAGRLHPQQQQNSNNKKKDDEIDESLANAGDVVVVDVEEFKRLRRRDNVAGEVEKAMAVRDRDELIEEAVTDGKISPGRRDHYKARYDDDPEGTTKLLARLTKNTVPLIEEGKDTPTDDQDQTGYDPNWLPEVAAQQPQAQQQQRRSRVHSET